MKGCTPGTWENAHAGKKRSLALACLSLILLMLHAFEHPQTNENRKTVEARGGASGVDVFLWTTVSRH
jgi:hypothetical protein